MSVTETANANETVKTGRKIISSEVFCKKLVEAFKNDVTNRDFAIDLYELGENPSDEDVKAAMLSVNSKRNAVSKKIREVDPEFSLPKLPQESRPTASKNLLDIFSDIKSDEAEAAPEAAPEATPAPKSEQVEAAV